MAAAFSHRAWNAAGSARDREFAGEVELAFAKSLSQSCAGTFLRKRRLRTRTGRKKESFRQAIQREPSGEMPPPGTTQCRCG